MSDTRVKITCTDTRCNGQGITWCARCNGHGLLSPKGDTYRQDRTAYRRNHDGESFPTWAVEHAECNGTGHVACGCIPLDAVMLNALRGTMTGVAYQRFSTDAGSLVDVGKLVPSGTAGRKATTPQRRGRKPAPAPAPAPAVKVPRPRHPVTGRFLRKGETVPDAAPAPAEPVDHSMDDLDWDAIEAAQDKARAILPKLTGAEQALLKTQLNGVVMVGHTPADRKMHGRLARFGLLAEHQRKSGAVPVRDLAKYAFLLMTGKPLVRPAHLVKAAAA